jgi:hypothetical protein
MRRDQQRERDILDRRARGDTLYEIAEAYGLTHSRISQILCRAGAPARPRRVLPGSVITESSMRMIWARLTADPVEVWICPVDELVGLRIVAGAERWVQGALMVGVFSSAVLFADFADAVHETLKEFNGRKGALQQ